MATSRSRVAVLLGLGLLVGCTPPVDSQTWAACDDNAAVECVRVSVPVDWAEPDGDAIEIAVARRTTAHPEWRVGTLVHVPGGPGSSGVATLTDDTVFERTFPDEVRQHFDIVSFDPRGVGASSPVRCDESLFAALDSPAPRNQAEFESVLAAQAELGRSCRERTGPVIDHLDSVAAAHDLDALRETLGEDRLTVYAHSYGTVLGQMYAEQFPHRLRAMVLDAVVDHGADTEQAEVVGARAAQEAFDVFVDWCAGSTACAVHGEDVRALVASLVAQADAGELTDPDTGAVLDRRGLARYLLTPLADAAVVEVGERIEALTGADGSWFVPSVSAASRQLDPSALPAYLYCADHRHDVRSYAELRRIAERAAEVAPDVKTGRHGPPSVCLNPPFETSNPQHDLAVEGAPPILVTAARYDDRTPHENARRVAEQLGDARLVSYDGLGHGAAFRGQCMRSVVTDYLLDGTLPEPGTRCPAEPLP
ncbi:alpha/beta hydrolase [Saccharomonospora sp. NB11]|uniref:alpha/beta hydrolase n=1 Tax=Saccharomonospora sp. NB11 TaxID=1642298 RepID=UPI0018D0303F|nr:alpha/beta hydrolase [Saccharomonospora sp. NB11]